MALTDPQDTLAYHSSRVFVKHREMTNVPFHLLAKTLAAHMNSDVKTDTRPEAEAVWFYGMNHGMALISANYALHEPLAPEDLHFVQTYHEQMTEKAVRAFYYLLIICNRESRHNASPQKIQEQAPKLFPDGQGIKISAWLKAAGQGEGGIHKAMLNSPPDVTCGTFVDQMYWQFMNCSWPGGYGGKKWGDVNDCLLKFVHGTYTAEMMLDTVWTLAHNGGPIFNKGHLYQMYTGTLARLLDVQRSGQIPEAVLFDKAIANFASPELKHLMKWVKQRFPKDIGDFVDWFKVENLGAVHKYPNEQGAQVAAHGAPEGLEEAIKLKAEKEAAKAAAKAEEQAKKKAMSKLAEAEKKEKFYQLAQDVYIPKVSRAEAAS